MRGYDRLKERLKDQFIHWNGEKRRERKSAKDMEYGSLNKNNALRLSDWCEGRALQSLRILRTIEEELR